MADMFQDMAVDQEKKGQTVKSNEITGERFQFHSLPKEYQDWHNNYYIIEKQGPIDNNAVSKAILNGYSWKTIADGSFYGILATVSTIAAIIKWKISGGFLGVLITIAFFLPVMFYVAFHFPYYAMIRAQIIGPVTAKSAQASTFTFYITFFGVYLSLIVVFIFFVVIAQDLLLLLFLIIKSLDAGIVAGTANSIVVWTYNALIWFHNFVVEFISGNGSILESIYTVTFVFVGFSLILIYYIEKKYYEAHVIDIKRDVKKTRDGQLYPIESAQAAMKIWRKENGV